MQRRKEKGYSGKEGTTNSGIRQAIVYPCDIFHSVSGCVIEFETRTGSHYSILLDDFCDYFGLPNNEEFKVMFFSLNRRHKGKGKELGIANTVSSALIKYMEESNHMLFYVCSDIKGQGVIRDKLFRKWFETFNTGEFELEHRVVLDEEYLFIYKTANTAAQKFISKLDEYLYG